MKLWFFPDITGEVVLISILEKWPSFLSNNNCLLEVVVTSSKIPYWPKKHLLWSHSVANSECYFKKSLLVNRERGLDLTGQDMDLKFHMKEYSNLQNNSRKIMECLSYKPNHLCPSNSFLKLHQSLFILVSLHENTGHFYSSKPFPLGCGNITL